MYNDPRDSAPHRWPYEKGVADMMYRMEAEHLLDLEDKEKAIQRIVDFQSEIEFLERYYKVPLLLFLKDHGYLVDQYLGKDKRRCKNGNYQEEPHFLMGDLFDLIFCMAGYGPFYTCPIERYEYWQRSHHEG